MTYSKLQTLSFLGLLAIPTLSAHASPITVREAGVGSNEIVNIKVLGTPVQGNVYAGILDLGLTQPGSTTEHIVNGFCIDPYHWSGSGAMAYQTASLYANPTTLSAATNAKDMATLTVRQASTIAKLWTLDFNKALTSNVTAAALQIAIWETVAGSQFVLEDHQADYGLDAEELLQGAAEYHGQVDNLEALRGPISGQDYVCATPDSSVSVPDGGSTLLLLSSAVLILGCFHRRYAFAAARG